MKRSDFSNSGSEILDIFAEIAEREHMLDKTAEYGLFPEGLFETNKTGQELDINMAVIASEHGNLYGVTHETGEQLVGDAHPKNTKTHLDNNKPEKGLDVIETIVEQHNINEGIARKVPTGKLAGLSERLSKLADAMDAGGFEVLADRVDGMIERFAAEASDKEILAYKEKLYNDTLEKVKPEIVQEYNGQISATMLDTLAKKKADEAVKAYDREQESGTSNQSQVGAESAPTQSIGTPLATKPARRAQMNPALQALQEQINTVIISKNINTPKLNPDGIWGPKTVAGLAAIGVPVGKGVTFEELQKRVSALAPAAQAPAANATATPGSAVAPESQNPPAAAQTTAPSSTAKTESPYKTPGVVQKLLNEGKKFEKVMKAPDKKDWLESQIVSKIGDRMIVNDYYRTPDSTGSYTKPGYVYVARETKASHSSFKPDYFKVA